jgi:hypothetical protein
MSFDFDAAVSAPFHMQPGLRRLADGTAQLTPNVAPERGTACHVREKLAVLQAFPTQALLSRDGFDARPALDALARHAAQEHPQAFWWRTERQSFIPVDGQQQAVFAIHVEVQPLTRALADPGRAAPVHDALATMSPAVLHYRGLATVRDRLLRWLAER